MNRSHASFFRRVSAVVLALAAATVSAPGALARGPEVRSAERAHSDGFSAGDGMPSTGLFTLTASGGSYLEGVDVSHWNGRVQWGLVAAAGIDFAIAKATDGRYMVDSQYANNRYGAPHAGLAFTAYHFARPDSSYGDAVAEAEHFVRTAKLLPGHLLPVLDLEKSGTLTYSQLKRWTFTWLNRVKYRLGGVRPVIYTSASFWRRHMNNTAEFANFGYLVWAAHWDTTSPTLPAIGWAGSGWTFWQYTACGHVPGFRGCVDRDRFNGTSLARVTLPR